MPTAESSEVRQPSAYLLTAFVVLTVMTGTAFICFFQLNPLISILRPSSSTLNKREKLNKSVHFARKIERAFIFYFKLKGKLFYSRASGIRLKYLHYRHFFRTFQLSQKMRYRVEIFGTYKKDTKVCLYGTNPKFQLDISFFVKAGRFEKNVG